VIDPVCGMTVKLNAGKPSHEWKGETYHFCNPKCCHKFEADPVFYLTGKNKLKAKAAPKNTTFTCPMDPEIVQEGPARARSAAWRLSRWARRWMVPTMSLSILPAGCGCRRRLPFR
jgi:YHS domain-containing protein